MIWHTACYENSIPPNLEETMRTDNLFYKLLEKQPNLALRLANLDVPTKAQYHFTAIELKQKAQRPDAVLLPNDLSLPVIILEVQYWLDALIYTRLVSETALLHLQHPEYTQFQMLLFLRSRQIDVESGVWSGLLASGAIRVVYLDEITDSLMQEPFRNSFAPDEQSALLLMHLTITPENRSADDMLSNSLPQALRIATRRHINGCLRIYS
jgi:predicted transposase YdaD